jgi:putative salt-induced outer membrane protein YdiY
MKKYFIEPRQFSSLLSLQTVLAENDRLNQKSPYSGVTVSGFAADSGRSLRSKLNSQLHIDMSEGSATKDALYRRLNDKKRDIVDHIVKIEARIQDLE